MVIPTSWFALVEQWSGDIGLKTIHRNKNDRLPSMVIPTSWFALVVKESGDIIIFYV
jgi:hypothetical protein